MTAAYTPQCGAPRYYVSAFELCAFVAKLRRSGPTPHGQLAIMTSVEKDRVVFSGGAHGAHSIAVSASSLERIGAHFDGYCEANGLGPIAAGGQ